MICWGLLFISSPLTDCLAQVTGSFTLIQEWWWFSFSKIACKTDEFFSFNVFQASSSRAQVETDTRVVWSLKKNRSYSIACLFHSAHLTLTSACLKGAKKRKQQQTKNSKKTPAQDARLKIVIVMSAQDEVGEFWRALFRVVMFISKGKLNNTEYIVQINWEISLTKVCLTCRHHATFLENNELFIASAFCILTV